MNKPLAVVLVTVGLDAVGIGLVLPILPGYGVTLSTRPGFVWVWAAAPE